MVWSQCDTSALAYSSSFPFDHRSSLNRGGYSMTSGYTNFFAPPNQILGANAYYHNFDSSPWTNNAAIQMQQQPYMGNRMMNHVAVSAVNFGYTTPAGLSMLSPTVSSYNSSSGQPSPQLSIDSPQDDHSAFSPFPIASDNFKTTNVASSDVSPCSYASSNYIDGSSHINTTAAAARASSAGAASYTAVPLCCQNVKQEVVESNQNAQKLTDCSSCPQPAHIVPNAVNRYCNRSYVAPQNSANFYGGCSPVSSNQAAAAAAAAYFQNYAWMRGRSDSNSSECGSNSGSSARTRTRDKYRMVYNDVQRLELEKEFRYNKYINIQRKAELSRALGLTDRQIKIWFQNRRAKERKLNRKSELLLNLDTNSESVAADSTLDDSNYEPNGSSPSSGYCQSNVVSSMTNL